MHRDPERDDEIAETGAETPDEPAAPEARELSNDQLAAVTGSGGVTVPPDKGPADDPATTTTTTP
jgi:hypothetical protein